MLKITRMSDYAVVVLVELMQTKSCMSVSGLAQEMKLTEPTISKVLKALVQAGIVISRRGSNGGYSLAASPQDISVEQIINAIDGPIAITDCANGNEPDCVLSDVCSIRGRWDGVNTAIRGVLSNVTLADMAGGMHNKEKEQRHYGSY
ncbi:MAG: SUF system Fe-S cluster assembly regulator [Alphaproteobacteria bacterium]|nr:MAG: SUF system Fe-S cluster assembly regulator [Alphaproteobacteria bacterium]